MASSLPKVPAARPTDYTSVYRKPAADAMLVRQANHVGKREVLVPER
jgi:hypothetical protein